MIEEETGRTAVTSYGDTAFLVGNNLVEQSVILLPTKFLLWNAKSFDDITIPSLSVFSLLFPTPEVLLVGCGEKFDRQLPKELIEHFHKRGIVIEASKTSSAVSTFNVLNSEGRNVAAALLAIKSSAVKDN